MTAKSFRHKAIGGMQMCELPAGSWQEIDPAGVVPDRVREKLRQTDDNFREHPANSNPDNRMRTDTVANTNSIPPNMLACNELHGVNGVPGGQESGENRERLIAPSTFLRWCKFNLVGGIGIVVQFAALFFLRSVMHFHYLYATAIAVEAAVIHNFVWHEQFTWADRVRVPARDPSGAEAQCHSNKLFTALTRCATQKRYGPSLRRLVRFNLTNGAVSVLGNLALMRVMVGQGHLNYLLANGIAIGLCSVANFLVSEEWVFAGE
jgi:putative flippase GtrA